MTVKERVLRRIDELDEMQLLRLERELNTFQTKRLSKEEQVRLWRELRGILSDPDDFAAFEEMAQRRPLFGGRTLDLEPDALASELKMDENEPER